ncbi:transglutaminase domain-containing protein [Candidatus Woesearchaeota archaeon]|nr:transglutaminase domain-containing protein [Candidatus Woesearchaeota archaeon]
MGRRLSARIRGWLDSRRQRTESDGEDLPAYKFSYWTKWHKAGILLASSVLTAGVVTGAVCYDADIRRRSDYQERFDEMTEEYQELPAETIVVGNCLRPGNEAILLRSSLLNSSERDSLQGMVVTDGDRNTLNDIYENIPMLCIRPVDGGQDVDLESRVTIRGLETSHLGRGSFRLRIDPGVPGIFSQDYTVDRISIDGVDIPVSYIDYAPPKMDWRQGYFFLDLEELVDDGVVAGFDGEVEISIDSRVEVDVITRLPESGYGPTSSYSDMPVHIRDFLKSTSEFPASDSRVRDIITAYSGDRADVYDLMSFSMGYVDDVIDYYLPGNHDMPVTQLLDERQGNCLDYARLFVTMMRGFGVPARIADAHQLVSNDGVSFAGLHAWAEVYVPEEDGGFRWIIVEPTWSDDAFLPEWFIGSPISNYLYRFDVDFSLDAPKLRHDYEIYQEHRLVSEPRPQSSAGIPGTTTYSHEIIDVL